MSIIRRDFLWKVSAASGMLLGTLGRVGASDSPDSQTDRVTLPDTPEEGIASTGPDPLYEKPVPITMAELSRRFTTGVSAVEVSDYVPGQYSGELTPSPPHADHNPRKAIIVIWSDKPHRFVFSHEASYDPWMELPNGVGLCNQFFEGNNGWAELFNDKGRKERNSFVDIIQRGPQRAWVRWNYFCVNQDDDSHPALRGAEDYIAYPNGLVWRRLTYETLMPDKPEGYSWQPIDYFAIAPPGSTWKDLFPQDKQHGDYHVGSVMDAYSDKRYDKYWDRNGKARRTGDAQLLLEISHSRGLAIIMPLKAGALFTILGASSGFPSEKSQVVDHSFDDTGGWGWGAARWDHWPIGWLNSQSHDYDPSSPYPFHFGPFSHYIVNKPLNNCKVEYPIEAADMQLNRWSERHVYYTLTGVGQDLESIRHLAKQWLDKGVECARPESTAGL